MSLICAACALVSSAFCEGPQELSKAASAALTSKNYRQAEQLYRKLIQAIPDSGELYSNLGLAFYSQEKIEPAETVFKKALSLNPNLFVPHFILGRIYFDRRRYSQALPYLEAAWRAQRQRDVLRPLATTLVALQRPREAIANYQAFLSENPNDVEAYYGLGLVYLDLGRKAIDQLATFKDSAFVFLVRAEYYSDRTEWAAVAESNYREAAARSHDLPGLHWPLGLFLVKRGEWEAAAALFTQELATNSRSPEAHFGLAAIGLHRGDLEAALGELELAAELRPQYFIPLPSFPCGCNVSEFTGVQHKLEQAAGRGSFAAAYLLSAWAGVYDREEVVAHLRSRIAAAPDNSRRAAVGGIELARELAADGETEKLVQSFQAGNSVHVSLYK